MAEKASAVTTTTMSSSFTGSFGDDDFMAYDPRLVSQGFNSSFSQFEGDSVKDSAGDSSPIFSSQSYGAGDEVFSSNPLPDTPSPPSIYAAGSGFSSFSPERNGKSFGGGFGAEDDSILPPPTEMPAEEGFALREWRR